ncbi:MAG: ROK family protein [Lentisphaeria bacterium]|jgi:glucokinase|nr:ROK family protein [Lentisphaeria bacterium]NLZ59727.1 ROK family protein [Lentisphaerota bacterium]
MSNDSFPVLGVDVGGTKIAVSIVDSAAQILASERIGMAPYEEVLPQILQLSKDLAQRCNLPLEDLRACGVCAPGPLDMEGGRIMKSPNMSWDAAPIRDDLQKALQIPTALENDANAGVLAEWFFGCAKGKKDLIYLTMSTGVGGGIVSGGKLITGKTGIAGELGHVVLDVNGPPCGCGQYGCLEAYCGGMNVAKRLQEELRTKPEHAMFKLPEVNGKIENLTFQALREGAKAGIPLAMRMWDEICFRLAQGLGLYMASFNPEQIVLGTAAYYAGDFLLNPVLAYLPRFAWKEFRDCCEIRTSELGLKIGELAGASVALNALQ